MRKKVNNFKKSIASIYKIKIRNIVFVISITVIFLSLFKKSVEIIPNLINVHLNLDCHIDFLTIYSITISLILPLAIMIIEKLNKESDYITSETYLKYTMMFPIIIYFCSNLIIFTFYKEKYYFMVTNLISIIGVIYMYFNGFKLLSDLRYEKEKIANTRYELVKNDLDDQTKDYSSHIDKYLKYGIVVVGTNYVYTQGYKKIPIKPSHHLYLITNYNYKLLDKLIKILKKYNKDSIEMPIETSNSTLDNTHSIEFNIIIYILNTGSTLKKDQSCITIYYKSEYEAKVEEIKNMFSDKIYVTKELNNHFYIKSNYEYLSDECIKAINSSSCILFKKSLNKHLDIYKDYVMGIKEKIGDYSYNVAYEDTHTFYQPKIYELLELIQDDIIDYSKIILKQDNSYLMNELISFLYSMIFYSYDMEELLSINYLYNTYEILMSQTLKLTNNESSYYKIKLNLFEFINIVEYGINLENKNFNKDVLLVCNKTIGKILYELSEKNEKYFFEFLKKDMRFIDEVDSNLRQVKRSKNDANIKITKIYEEILSNYKCNLFAILSYVISEWEKQNKDITNILQYYEDYDGTELTNILLDTIDKDYNDRTYSWDLLDDNIFDDDYVGWSNTITNLIHFYCVLLHQNNIKKLPSNYTLSTYSETIKNELKKLNDQELIDAINDLENKIKEDEKKYIRSTPISLEKVNMFKDNFKENYYKNNTLDKIFKYTNNFIIETNKLDGKNYLGLNNIVDKLYFLEKMPNGQNIIWNNFESSFSSAFINAEEEKYASLLEEKSNLLKTDFMKYLDSKNIDYNKYVIFADYLTAYNILQSSNIISEIPNNIKYNGLPSTHYFKYNNNLIPIYSIEGLNEDYVYLFNINELGKLIKSDEDFKIEIKEYLNNDDLIKKAMKSKIKGLNLKGEERKNHLLESVNIIIEEYIRFDDTKIKGIKFNK